MSKKWWWLIIPLVLVAVYLAGPQPTAPNYDPSIPRVPVNAVQLEHYIASREALHRLRPDNEARVVWADSARKKTEYSIVYLHGFSASQGEGEPVHRNIAKRFHCNLYLSRLAEHGIDTTEQLLNYKAESAWASAKEAFAIGTQIGHKVILVGTSTGGTLAVMLAAAYPQVESIVLLSPNVAIFDENAWLLNNPWGLRIARMMTGSDYIFSSDSRPLTRQYWNYGYRIEALTELEEMLETAMVPETFRKVSQPALMLYYYKDTVHQDSVVKVAAMKDMFQQLATPAKMKKAVAMPLAGNHVLGSYIKSRDVEGVEAEISKFLTEVLGLKPNGVR